MRPRVESQGIWIRRGNRATVAERLVVACCSTVLVAVCGFAVGCVTESSGPAGAQVFVELAETLAPIPVYGLAELPQESAVAQAWWPIVELESLAEYDGPPVDNPRVMGAGEIDAEAQLLLTYRAGTLAILENFRGDLGDVSGSEVGSVAGHPASLYEVNGGLLVQWSDGGRWYGVFARGVPEDDVVDVALQMKVVSAEETP